MLITSIFVDQMPWIRDICDYLGTSLDFRRLLDSEGIFGFVVLAESARSIDTCDERIFNAIIPDLRAELIYAIS